LKTKRNQTIPQEEFPCEERIGAENPKMIVRSASNSNLQLPLCPLRIIGGIRRGRSGRRAALPRPAPLRTVRATFTAHGSSNRPEDRLTESADRKMALLRRAYGSLFARRLHRRAPPVLSGRSPVGSRHPVGTAQWPIRPVRASRCLSAAGVRFLRHPLPAGGFGLPHGRLTGAEAPDPVGLTTSRRSETRLG
jgi:hypothetical protein